MGPTWGPSGADRTQVGPMLATWTLISGLLLPSYYVAMTSHFAAISLDYTSICPLLQGRWWRSTCTTWRPWSSLQCFSKKSIEKECVRFGRTGSFYFKKPAICTYRPRNRTQLVRFLITTLFSIALWIQLLYKHFINAFWTINYLNTFNNPFRLSIGVNCW